MKKYIVIGGGGYLGYVVALTLIERGYFPVVITALPNELLPQYDNLDVEIQYGNILDQNFLNDLITPGAVVFHLAGIVDISSGKNDVIYKVNVQGCKNVVDTCIVNKAEKLIYTSSVHTIVPLKKGEIMAEPNFFDIDDLVGDYAKSKAMATSYFLSKTNNKELNGVVVYPSGIVGPYDYHISNFGQVVLDYINHKLTAFVRGGYNFVDVRDVASGVVNAYEMGLSGEGYILSNEFISMKEIFKLLNEKLNRKRMPSQLALWFVKLMIPFAELHYRIRKKKPIYSKYSLYTLNVNSEFSNIKAKTYLKFNPRPLKESLFDMVDWLMKNKKDLILPKYRIE